MNERDPRRGPEVTAIPVDSGYSGYSGNSGPSSVGPEAAALERGRFLMRVYGHLLGAIAAFVGLEVFLFQTGRAQAIAQALLGVNWMLVLGGFMISGWLARGLAARAESPAMQYLGLGLYVVAQAVIFTPLLYMAESYTGGGVIGSAAFLTVLAFTGLTLIAWQTRRDFSFLGSLLRWAGVLALIAIAGGVFFGWELGMWFSVLMIGVAGGAILYDTSKIMNHWPGDKHVAAALELFASVALMFWYILRLLMGSRR